MNDQDLHEEIYRQKKRELYAMYFQDGLSGKFTIDVYYEHLCRQIDQLNELKNYIDKNEKEQKRCPL